MEYRIKESELILPALHLMELNDGAITTTELIRQLRLVMNPSGTDLEILEKRNDDKFSQKVRNLKSHGTFERAGYAKYVGNGRNSKIEITREGEQHLETNREILNYLLTNDFQYSDVKEHLLDAERNDRKKLIFDENIVIKEGIEKIRSGKIYERSAKLRRFAIAHFTENNRIICKCCLFDFEVIYGNWGKGFIEIHHEKPIFQYEDEDTSQSLARAVENLAPVCSNCHRMIHRKQTPLLTRDLSDKIKFARINHG